MMMQKSALPRGVHLIRSNLGPLTVVHSSRAFAASCTYDAARRLQAIASPAGTFTYTSK